MHYDILASDFEMWNFIDKTAAKIYRDWKCDCHNHYLKEGAAIPLEFLTREEELQYLVGHFNDPKYMATYARNGANQRKGNSINYHLGPKALSYRVEEFVVKGHPSLLVLAFVDAFAPNKTVRPKVYKKP